MSNTSHVTVMIGFVPLMYSVVTIWLGGGRVALLTDET